MARSFNGTTDNIITSAFAIPASGTLSIWVNPGTLSNASNGIIGQSVSPPFAIIFLKSTGKFAYYVSGAGNGAVDPGLASASGWTHVAMSYSVAAGMATYVNGTNDGTAVIANAPASTAVGVSFGFDSGNPGRNFPGSLADGAEWNTVLTADEIMALAKGARPYQIRPSNLIGWWPLGGFTSPEQDLSGNKNNGTLTGTAVAPGPPLMQFTPRRPMVLPFIAVTAIKTDSARTIYRVRQNEWQW